MALWDILPLGDSVTEGQSSSANYRSRLASSLQGGGIDSSFLGSMTSNTASFPAGFTHHEGHSGWCSTDAGGICQQGNASWDPSRPIGILEHITTWYTNNPADIVLLLIGINDASSSTLQTALGTILDDIHNVNASVRVLLGKIRTNGNTQTTKNTSIANAASGRSWVKVVDPYAGWVDSTDFSADGIHPNTTGYNKMADNWYGYIRTAINPNSQIDPTTPTGVQPTGFSNGYTLVMSDEFNSSTLDTKWNARRDASDANLPTTYDINAANNSAMRMWWNGNLSTDNILFTTTGTNPFRTRYGFFEARMQCPLGPGFFPAFWLYPFSNAHAENPDGNQPEIDIVEWFSYTNGDWLVTSSQNCKNASFTVWTEGGGGATTRAGYRELHLVNDSNDGKGNQGTFPGYITTLSTQYHVYGMRWTATDGLAWYIDGVQVGVPIPDPWGSGNNTQLAIFLQLWWGPNGGNPQPVEAETPTVASDTTSFLVDYVRVWSVGTTLVFNANLDTAPGDGTTVSGIVQFAIDGDLIANAELLPGNATLYTPIYGTFTLTVDANQHVTGVLNWDTTGLANGSYQVRISAFNTPPGSAGQEIIVMTRAYIVNNVAAGVATEFCFSDLTGLQGLKR